MSDIHETKKRKDRNKRKRLRKKLRALPAGPSGVPRYRAPLSRKGLRRSTRIRLQRHARYMAKARAADMTSSEVAK